MSDKINMQVIVYKAQKFNFNPQIIEHLIKSELIFDKDILKKFHNVINAVDDIEKSSQLSI